jgi:hypothetical protein
MRLDPDRSEHESAADEEFPTFADMLTTAPTSMAGVIALLEYLTIKPYDRENKFPLGAHSGRDGRPARR